MQEEEVDGPDVPINAIVGPRDRGVRQASGELPDCSNKFLPEP